MDDEGLKGLKRTRSAAKGYITRVQNEIKDLLLNVDNLDSVKEKLPDLDLAAERFRSAHENYHSNLTDEVDVEESQEYFESEMARVYDLKQRVDAIATASVLESRRSCRSNDECSSVTSRRSSRISTRSAIAAKKASLKAQAALLKKRQALQEEEFRVKQRLEELDLETEIAKATAIEEVYEDLSDEDLESSTETEESSIASHYMDASVDLGQSTETSDSFMQPSVQAKQTDFKLPKIPMPVTVKLPADSKLSSPTLLKYSTPSTTTILTDSMPSNPTLPMLQQRLTLVLMLPHQQVPTFSGDPLEY